MRSLLTIAMFLACGVAFIHQAAKQITGEGLNYGIKIERIQAVENERQELGETTEGAD